MILRNFAGRLQTLAYLLLILRLLPFAQASTGDRLPEFRECVSTCVNENCHEGSSGLPLSLRVLWWTCPSNCDYVCQHIVTDRRKARDPPMLQPIHQFHGKWPFYRFLGMQEPFSVLFSGLNFLAHYHGLSKIQNKIPSSYAMRPYYVAFGCIGMASWVFSMIFHTRDFDLTEKLDYFAAGASVFYGLYYTPIRIFRLDQKKPSIKPTMLRLWTLMCGLLYAGHVSYLSFWHWDYVYNMAANVAAGIVQNILWSGFSYKTYHELKKPWAAWPGMIVAWIILAMSLELLDFPPLWGILDAHSLWHLGTVGPTVWWYNFLIKDAQQDIAGARLKA